MGQELTAEELSLLVLNVDELKKKIEGLERILFHWRIVLVKTNCLIYSEITLLKHCLKSRMPKKRS